MPATTLRAIMDRFQAVLEATPLSLTHNEQPFSFNTQPNAALADRYWVQDVGLNEAEETTNNAELRLDELTVWIARALTPTGQTAVETVQDDLVTIQRRIFADGPANNYYPRVTGREIQLAEDGDVVIGAVRFQVDYDLSTATV